MDIKDPHNLDLKLIVNNEDRVQGNTGQMVYKIGKMMEMISHHMKLETGDLILTGTPVPAGTIVAGDQVHVSMSESGNLLSEFKIVVEEI